MFRYLTEYCSPGIINSESARIAHTNIKEVTLYWSGSPRRKTVVAKSFPFQPRLFNTFSSQRRRETRRNLFPDDNDEAAVTGLTFSRSASPRRNVSPAGFPGRTVETSSHYPIPRDSSYIPPVLRSELCKPGRATIRGAKRQKSRFCRGRASSLRRILLSPPRFPQSHAFPPSVRSALCSATIKPPTAFVASIVSRRESGAKVRIRAESVSQRIRDIAISRDHVAISGWFRRGRFAWDPQRVAIACSDQLPLRVQRVAAYPGWIRAIN